MWKESYRIGVDAIDKQHMELFSMVDKLLAAIQNSRGDNREHYMSAITYLKEYTLSHFRDEEEYQKSIGYPGLPQHRAIHQKFAMDVLTHEQRMVVSNFSNQSVKDFMGMLIAWLVYHVAGDDQLIVSKKQFSNALYHKPPIDGYFQISACDTLKTMADLDMKGISIVKQIAGHLQPTISVQVNIDGDVSGAVTYRFTSQFAFSLINNLSSFSPNMVDELVCSAMSELSNIISVRATGLMSSHGVSCSTNIPVVQVFPAFLPSDESIAFDTALGLLDIEVAVC